MKNNNRLLNKQINNSNKKHKKEMSLKEFQVRWSKEWCKVVMLQLKKKRKKLMNKECSKFNLMKKSKSNKKF